MNRISIILIDNLKRKGHFQYEETWYKILILGVLEQVFMLDCFKNALFFIIATLFPVCFKHRLVPVLMKPLLLKYGMCSDWLAGLV